LLLSMSVAVGGSGVTIISGPPGKYSLWAPPNLILTYGDTGLKVYVTVEVPVYMLAYCEIVVSL